MSQPSKSQAGIVTFLVVGEQRVEAINVPFSAVRECGTHFRSAATAETGAIIISGKHRVIRVFIPRLRSPLPPKTDNESR